MKNALKQIALYLVAFLAGYITSQMIAPGIGLWENLALLFIIGVLFINAFHGLLNHWWVER